MASEIELVEQACALGREPYDCGRNFRAALRRPALAHARCAGRRRSHGGSLTRPRPHGRASHRQHASRPSHDHSEVAHPPRRHRRAIRRGHHDPRAEHDRMANAIRALAMDAVEQAKSGHPGLPMGAADIATVLFTRFLKFDPADPTWPDRDRFVLSAGHGSMLLYALLHLIGYAAMTHRGDQALPPARLDHARPSGEFRHARHRDHHRSARPGPRQCGRHGDRRAPSRGGVRRRLVDHRTYVLASDGDLMEGISQEAIALAGHLKLNRLIVLFDDNGISIDGPLSLADSVDQVKRFEAAGWAACRVDGHDPDAIAAAIEQAQAVRPPDADRLQDHHRLRRADQGRQVVGATARRSAPTRSRARARSSAGAHAPFDVPADMRDAWRAGRRALAADARRPGTSASPRSIRPSAPSSSAACAATCRRTSSPPRCAP